MSKKEKIYYANGVAFTESEGTCLEAEPHFHCCVASQVTYDPKKKLFRSSLNGGIYLKLVRGDYKSESNGLSLVFVSWVYGLKRGKKK